MKRHVLVLETRELAALGLMANMAVPAFRAREAWGTPMFEALIALGRAEVAAAVKAVREEGLLPDAERAKDKVMGAVKKALAEPV